MPNYHQCQVVGHLGKDPETRFTSSGDPVASFSVAYTEKWGEKEQTTWFRVSAWKKLAEIAQKYLRKGDAVMVVGRMQCRKYQDKDGQQRESWELNADQIKLMGARKEGDTPTQEQLDNRKAAAARVQQRTDGGLAEMDSDIPF